MFANDSLISTAILFLNEERHFSQDSLSTLLAMINAWAVLAEMICLPLASKMGMNQYSLMLLGSICALSHMGMIAGVSDVGLFMTFDPFLSGFDVTTVVAISILSGTPSLGNEVAADQGTLMGVLHALSALATCVGSTFMAAATLHWRGWSAPFNVPGIGYWCLCACEVPAVLLAGYAYVRQMKRERRTNESPMLECDALPSVTSDL